MEEETGRKVTRSGNGKAFVTAVDLLNDGKSVRAVRSGEPITIRVSIKVQEPIDELTVGILIRDPFGNDVFGTNTFHHGCSLNNPPVEEDLRVDFRIPKLLLGKGSYSLTVALHKDHSHLSGNYDWWDRAVVFEVVPGNYPLSIGVCNLPVSIEWV
ncbi:MAG: Wzt carbohydrate-binding domain-containing protein [Syntrophobacterales bacterium]|nr:Wzt carbohydrate-binding domain-containing protein [Syntrophobacterales bacterium]